MEKPKIPLQEFHERVIKIKQVMAERHLDIVIVYGDEYRKENLRYISNYWPIFERGAAVISQTTDPIILAAPEGEMVCREMSCFPDVRLVPDFACVTVTDVIEYPHANYTSFKAVFDQLAPVERIAIVGLDAMSNDVKQTIVNSLQEDAEVIDGNEIITELRKTKSSNEAACLKEAARIADVAYEALMKAAKPGVTESALSAAAHQAAFAEGAEMVPFCLVSSGPRVNTIIGRATNKVIADGEMVMAALAIQYEGYVATINFPFVVGEATEEQKKLIDLLITAEDLALQNLKPGVPMKQLVASVKDYFRSHGVSDYDLYPPLHGCGVAEAESPYPNEGTEQQFAQGMTVNTDISLFGHPAGSNRIEESLIVTEDGYESMSKLIRRLSEQWQRNRSLSL